MSDKKPGTRKISLRLPLWVLDGFKALADRQDVGYQPLIKMVLSDYLTRYHEDLTKTPEGEA